MVTTLNNNMENQDNQLAVASAPKKPNALMALADRLSISPEKLEMTLKKTVFKSCKTDEEFAVLVAVSNEYDLNPLTKQIYAFPAKGGGIEPIVSIDGWLHVINNQSSFDGMTVEISPDGSEATCSIYVKGRTHPTVITEYFEECKRNTEPWKQMPKRMLRHKAIMQCGRVAFGISGIYDEDEAKDISDNSMRDVTPKSNVREIPLDPFEKKEESVEQVEPVSEAEVVTENTDDPKMRDAFINDVELKTGEKKNGQPYTVYIADLSNGEKVIQAATFSKTLGAELDRLKGKFVKVALEKDGVNFKVTKVVEQEEAVAL